LNLLSGQPALAISNSVGHYADKHHGSDFPTESLRINKQGDSTHRCEAAGKTRSPKVATKERLEKRHLGTKAKEVGTEEIHNRQSN